MEALLSHLLVWGKAEGYRSFALGMAPMSGFERSPVAPLWSRLGTFLYEHGDAFYNFQGLRAFKEKFSPDLAASLSGIPGRPAAGSHSRRHLRPHRRRLQADLFTVSSPASLSSRVSSGFCVLGSGFQVLWFWVRRRTEHPEPSTAEPGTDAALDTLTVPAAAARQRAPPTSPDPGRGACSR